MHEQKQQPLPTHSPHPTFERFTPDPLHSMYLRIFVLVALVFMLLPIWLPFQDVLVRWMIRSGWYRPLQQYIVPYELHLINVFLHLLGFHYQLGRVFLSWQTAHATTEVIYFTWNCTGWQSFLFFFLTTLTGLRGNYTLLSKYEAFFLGLLLTYLFTMLRLMAVLVLYLQLGRPFGVVFHDYVTMIFSFIYLAFFWLFAYRFILKRRGGVAGRSEENRRGDHP